MANDSRHTDGARRDMRHVHRIGLNRRELLQVGYSGLLGIGLPAVLSGRKAQAAGNLQTGAASSQPKSVVLIFLTGAPSHHDTFDMNPEAPAEVSDALQPFATRGPA